MATVEIKLGNRNLVTIIDEEDYPLVKDGTWFLHHQGYVQGRLPGSRKMVIFHRVIAGHLGSKIDHVNGNPLDNRRSNLRACTTAQNNANRRVLPRNKSGFKGVHWNKAVGKWCAQIEANCKRKVLGYFSDVRDAARAYDVAARELHGEFAVLNFGGAD